MKHYAVSCTSRKLASRPSIIRSGTPDCWHRPVILGDARPEDPDHDHGKERKQGLEKTTVDLARGSRADVDTDDILEDLSNCEENHSTK